MRHLIFYVTPFDNPAMQSCWKWHLRQLNHYAPIFDGQRIFAIATGRNLLPPDSILEFLPPRSQIISVPHSDTIREAYALPLLLAKAFTTSPLDAVFYAHNKGISWVGGAMEAPARWWSLTMYRWLFRQSTMDMLKSYPLVGWRKHDGYPAAPFPQFSHWHYSGTFWWFNAAAVYTRAWWNVEPNRFGAEAYLSRLFPSESAACHHSFPAKERLANGNDPIYFIPFWQAMGIPTGPDAESYEGSPVADAPVTP